MVVLRSVMAVEVRASKIERRRREMLRAKIGGVEAQTAAACCTAHDDDTMEC